MTKLTEAHIHNAMSLKPNVQVTLGTLDEPCRTRIAVVDHALYSVRQIGFTVTMQLQFCGVPISPFRCYPSTVQFCIVSAEEQGNVERLQLAVSELVTALQAEGSHDDATAVAALLTLPLEDLIRVHDALYVGMTRDTFLKALARGLGVPAKPVEMFRVYQMRMTDNGPVALYACGAARGGSKETQWRASATSAHHYNADGVEALRINNPALKLRTEEVQ